MPRIAYDAALNAWVAIWVSEEDLVVAGGSVGNDEDVLYSKYSHDGQDWSWSAAAPVDLAKAIGDDALDLDRSLSIAADGDGTWIAVWNAVDDSVTTQSEVIYSIFTDDVWTTGSVIHPANPGFENGAADIAADGHGNWVVMWSTTGDFETTRSQGLGLDQDMFATSSANGGASWSPPVLVGEHNAVAKLLETEDSDDQFPELATDGRGTWMAVWQSRGAADASFDVLASRSSDQGASWSEPEILNLNAADNLARFPAPDDSEEVQAFPAVATDGNGNWRAMWHSIDSAAYDPSCLPSLGGDYDILTTPIFINPAAAQLTLWSNDAGAAIELPSGDTVVTTGSLTLAFDTRTTLTAPLIHAGGYFSHWKIEDCEDVTQNTLDLVLDRDLIVGAVYTLESSLLGPTDFSAVGISTTKIELRWKDASISETGFDIERKTGAGAYENIIGSPFEADSTIHTDDNGLAAETSYDYRVRAARTSPPYESEDADQSDWVLASATTLDADQPTTPIALTAFSATADTISIGSVNLTWTHGGGADLSGFAVGSRPEGGSYAFLADLAPSLRAHAVVGLTQGVQYDFRIQAVNGATASAWISDSARIPSLAPRVLVNANGPTPDRNDSSVGPITGAPQLEVQFTSDGADPLPMRPVTSELSYLVTGSQSGWTSYTLTNQTGPGGIGPRWTLDQPWSRSFFPGERVTVGLTTNIESLHDAPGRRRLATPYQWEFTTKTGAAESDFVFGAPVKFGLASDPINDVQLGDMDGDGDLDLVTAMGLQQNLIFLNHLEDGTPRFNVPPADTSAFGASTTASNAIALADFDLDGQLDVAVANAGSSNTLHLNRGYIWLDDERADTPDDAGWTANSGINARHMDYRTTDTQRGRYLHLYRETGSQEGDQAAQFSKNLNRLTGRDRVGFWMKNGGGAPAWFWFKLHVGATDFRWLVFETDDGTDFINQTPDPDEFHYYLGSGLNDGAWHYVTLDLDARLRALDWTLSFVDLDEFRVSAVNLSLDSVIARGALDGGELSAAPIQLDSNSTDIRETWRIEAGDINGDGWPDVVAANLGGRNAIYLHNGQTPPTFTEVPFGSPFSMTTSIALGDLDNDGDLDIVEGNFDEFDRFYLNTGGTFSEGTTFGPARGRTLALALGDADEDGRLDLMAGASLSDLVTRSAIYINSRIAGAPFGASGRPVGETGIEVADAAWVDVDGDGRLDLVTGGSTGASFVHLNDPESLGQFFAAGNREIETEGGTRAIAAGDLNGDGLIDFAVANPFAQSKVRLSASPTPAPTPAPTPGPPFYTLARPLPLNTTGYFDRGTDWRPDIATDDNGHWVAVWESNENLRAIDESDGALRLAGPDMDILFARFDSWTSTTEQLTDPWATLYDGAYGEMERLAWMPPRALSWGDPPGDPDPDDPDNFTMFTDYEGHTFTKIDDLEPRVATDGEGNWAVMWYQYRGDSPNTPNPGLRYTRLLLSTSADDTASWSDPLILAERVGGSGSYRESVFDIIADHNSPSSGSSQWMAVWSVDDGAALLAEADPTTVSLGLDFDLVYKRTTAAHDGSGFSAWPADPTALNARAATDGPWDDDAERMGVRRSGLDIATGTAGQWIATWQSTQPLTTHPLNRGQMQYNGVDLDIYYATSEDYGASWSETFLLNSNGAGDYYIEANPVIETDRAGVWVAAWDSHDPMPGAIPPGSDQPADRDSGRDRDIFFTRSADGGASWDAARLVSDSMLRPLANGDPGDSGNSDFNPALATDGQGSWIISWSIPDPDYLRGLGGMSEEFAIDTWHAYSGDNAVTWTDAMELGIPSLYDPPARPAVSVDSSRSGVFAARADSAQKPRDFMGAWSHIRWMSETGVREFGLDFDVLELRSESLYPPGYTPPPEPTPLPPAPTPVPADCVEFGYAPGGVQTFGAFSAPLAAGTDFPLLGSDPPADYVEARIDDPHPDYTALASDSDGGAAWTVQDSLGDSLMLFYVNIDPYTYDDLRLLRLHFTGGRGSTGAISGQSTFSIWVMQGGYFGANDWNTFDAWSLVHPTVASNADTGVATLVADLGQDFIKQVTPAEMTINGATIPANSIIWAVHATGAGLGPISVDYAQGCLLYAPDPVPTPTPIPTPVPTNETYAATMDALQVDTNNPSQSALYNGKGFGFFTLANNDTDLTFYIHAELADGLTTEGLTSDALQFRWGALRGADAPTTQTEAVGGTIIHSLIRSGTWTLPEGVMEQLRASTIDDPGLSTVYVELRAMRGEYEEVALRGQIELDSDGDGVADYEEVELHITNRFDRDTDDDTLSDGEELRSVGAMTGWRATQPLLWDTDTDQLSDGIEVSAADMITTFTKNLSVNGGPSTQLISGTEGDTDGDGFHGALGFRFIDTDQTTRTDPVLADTDGDLFFDDPDQLIAAGTDVEYWRLGEDKNADGKYTPAGLDDMLNTYDDESNPLNETSRAGQQATAPNQGGKPATPVAISPNGTIWDL